MDALVVRERRSIVHSGEVVRAMKFSYVLVVLVIIGIACGITRAGDENPSDNAAAATAALPCKSCSLDKTESGPYACPQFVLVVLSVGTVYYCDFFDPDCDAEPQAAYMIGNYSCPMYCPDCVRVSSGAAARAFPGLDRSLSWPAADSDASTALSDNSLSFLDGSQADTQSEQVGCVRMWTGSVAHDIVVLSVDYRGRSGQQVSAQTALSSRYVGLEVEQLPEGMTPVELDSVEQLSNGRAFRSKFALPNGKQVPLLILLASSR